MTAGPNLNQTEPCTCCGYLTYSLKLSIPTTDFCHLLTLVYTVVLPQTTLDIKVFAHKKLCPYMLPIHQKKYIIRTI